MRLSVTCLLQLTRSSHTPTRGPREPVGNHVATMMFASVKQSGVAVNAPRRLGAPPVCPGQGEQGGGSMRGWKGREASLLPKSPREQVGQAAEAVRRAAADGKKQLAIEFTLPLIGATDLDDWPGGIGSSTRLLADGGRAAETDRHGRERGRGQAEIVDDADAVVVLSTAGAKVIMFPTAETLGDLKASRKRTLACCHINNQIRTNDDGSNLISDLGIGPWRRRTRSFWRRSS